jgi:hypothetical protein
VMQLFPYTHLVQLDVTELVYYQQGR